MRRLWIGLVWLAACGGACSGVDDSEDPSDTTDTTEAPESTVDPTVGDWIRDRIVQDGESRDLPAQGDTVTQSMEMSFTAEERGLLKQIFESEEDGQREAYTFEFIVDVFDVGRWLVEIEDPLSDMALDCEAEGDELTCSGECDGLSCTIHAVRAP